MRRRAKKKTRFGGLTKELLSVAVIFMMILFCVFTTEVLWAQVPASIELQRGIKELRQTPTKVPKAAPPAAVAVPGIPTPFVAPEVVKRAPPSGPSLPGLAKDLALEKGRLKAIEADVQLREKEIELSRNKIDYLTREGGPEAEQEMRKLRKKVQFYQKEVQILKEIANDLREKKIPALEDQINVLRTKG